MSIPFSNVNMPFKIYYTEFSFQRRVMNIVPAQRLHVVYCEYGERKQ